ncbi:PadR family transcriptional regulator, partial [Micromonospora chersina]|uniref:PadR family transcriptional regulator n=1 Tax=Micromonospora chersina TaxID=47854 RepID=UPI0037112134
MSMQEPTFLVLTVLAEGPRHGYGIMKAVEQVSRGAITVRPGALYAALDRLTVEGLIEVASEEAIPGGRARRYYRLTPLGANRLGSEAERRSEVAALAI